MSLPEIEHVRDTASMLSFERQSRTSIARHLSPEPPIPVIVVATKDVS